jgi:hypothetical protein
MAGMFYSLQQVIEKLGKNEVQIKTLVREGKLREFRDGAKQLYKVEDVEALASVPKGDTAILNDSMNLAIDETGEISLAPEELDMLMGDDNSNSKNESKFKLDETGALMADEVLGQEPPEGEVELFPADDAKDNNFDLGELAAEETKAGQKSGSVKSGSGIPDSDKKSLANGDTNISLSSDSINVLSNSDTEFKLSDDTSGETKLIKTSPDALDDKSEDEMSVARLDDDINLDSFGGSGSGLLDLSLQADDTSLGAVLDDIYPEPQNAVAGKAATPVGGLAAEAEKIFEQNEAQAYEQAETAPAAPAAIAMMAEPAPDAASNTFGITLFIPMIVMVYTAIVVVSGYKSISDLKILSSLEPIIWYAAGGAAALVILMAIIASVMSSGGTKKPKQAKVKQPKPKKEKKVKKGKQPAAEQQ